MKVGAPVMVITVSIATLYCIVVYDIIGIGH